MYENGDYYDKQLRYTGLRGREIGKVSKDIKQYIPKRLWDAGAIDDAFVDSDGYWIFLNEGWNADLMDSNCKTIHEYTIKDLKEQIAFIRRGQI